MVVLRALLGLAFFLAVAWLLSSDRRNVPWRVVAFGLLAQLGLAFALLVTEPGRALFQWLADTVRHLISLNSDGAALVFGPLADPVKMGEVFGPENGFIFAIAGTGLIAIIFFSALMSLLYHVGVMQVIIWALARVMSLLLGVSGAESMAMAANIFVGQTEAPLVVRPYLATMTRSELMALMTGGFATIAGSVLAVYVGFLGPEYGPHLLTASVMSAPAAFLIAKVLCPESGQPVTGGKVALRIDRSASNLIEAAANGTQDGLKLWLNVIAMLVAFTALVNFVNWPLESLGAALEVEGGLSLSVIFGWVFAPVAWFMGVQGWHDCQLFGSLLGIKVSLNEFVAFAEMKSFTGEPGPGQAVFEHARSAKMAAYALCGFANFASIGIQLGGISPLAPERKRDLSQIALKAMVGGAFASWMTATVAGMFL